jgi:hypothetical protein
MTRREAELIQSFMMMGVRQLALIASCDTVEWGVRYQAIVTADHCLEVAEQAAAYVRETQEA